MRNPAVFLVAMTLAGCANDQYTVTTGSGFDVALLQTSLKQCKAEALDLYVTSHYAGTNTASILLGGAGLGTGGGAAAGAMNQTDFPASEIDPYIERCMAAKGYTGHSEN